MKADFRQAPVSTRQAAILSFADKLSRTPWLAGPPDGADLRRAGLSDLEVLHVILGCAQFNYFNRVADGIGIALDYERTLPESGAEARPPGFEGAAGGEPREPPHAPAAARRSGWKEIEEVFAAMSPNPEMRDRALRWRAHHLRGTERIDRPSRLEIASSVAVMSRSELLKQSYRPELEEAAAADPPAPPRPELLEHAARLTRLPWTVNEGHLGEVRNAGLDDRGILELTTLVAYLNFECRCALGLEACFG